MPSPSKTPDASPRSFFQILKLHQLVYATLEKALLAHDLSPPQYTTLSLIRRHEPITPAELSRKLGITAQSALQTVKNLEERRLISRAAIPNNKRSISLSLTNEGRSAMKKADRLVLASETSFFSRLKPKDFKHLQDSIRLLRSEPALSRPNDPASSST